jgi:hypothetical protein
MRPKTFSCIGLRLGVSLLITLVIALASPALGPAKETGASSLPAPRIGGEQSRTPPRRPPRLRQQGLPPVARSEPPKNERKRERELLKQKFEKMKENADELAELAQSLQEDLNASNENVLSVGVVQKAQKIEKLAKKIKSAARGF